MHERTEKTTSQNNARVRGALWVIAVLIILPLLVSWMARSRSVIAPLLVAEARSRGLELTLADVKRAGFFAIDLRQVRVIQPGAATDVFLERVVVSPSIRDWLQGGLGVGEIVLSGADVTVSCDDTGLEGLRHDSVTTGDGPRARPLAPAGLLPGEQITLTDGQFRCAGTGRLGGMSARVRTLLARRQDDGVVVDGRVDVDGLGESILHGELQAGSAPTLDLRMIEDNDVFEVLGGQLAVDDDSTFSLGAVSASWPPRVVAQPVSVRRLSMQLPGLESWQVENIWSDSVEVSLIPDGYRVVARNMRLRLQGLLRASDVRLEVLSADWNWRERELTVGGTITDAAGRTLEVWAQRTEAGMQVAASSDGMDVSALTPLLSSGTTGVVSGGEFRGMGQADWSADEQVWRAQASAALSRLRITSPVLADEPVDIAHVSFLGQLEHDGRTGEWRTREVQASLGDAVVKFEFARRNAETGPIYELGARLLPVSLNALVGSLPYALTEALLDFRFTGSIEARAEAELNTGVPAESRVVVTVVPDADLGVVRWSDDAPVHRLDEPDFRWPIMRDDGVFEIGPGAAGWTPMSSLAEHSWRAVVAAEDDAFWRHNGFDLRGIEGAIRANLEAGRLIRGGSTISQQVVKNLFLSHDRSVGRKLQEIVLTWLLERELTKEQILEYYLNLAGWGERVVGIGSAAETYFGHGAPWLTLRESVFLAAILPNPNRFGRQYAEGMLEEARRVKMRNILVNLHRAGVVDDATFEESSRLVLQGLVSLSPLPSHFLDAAAAGQPGRVP